ncbi:hypothetical protein [Pyrococcus abyssi]|uniref:Uncharacterized protein n=1 Tax=Pyrococcus abyssi (strain GE5 / Orsay) TaxID=272844 RepID=G8ZHM6_PYRAB|nr:hypothetical protein [Pyrococcus abyssi]CCE70863.1 TPA: hypothetical protein PAB0940.1n [Pyrococcus abyssi GE5]
MKGFLTRRREKETISFLAEVLDKMARNGVIREDIIEEAYWTLKKMLRNKVDEDILQAFEDLVMLKAKMEKGLSPERYLENAKSSLMKALEG